MTRHQYYRGDTRISETEALDPSTGHLKDGVAVRVRSIMRDSDGRVLFTDGTPDGGGNRPGEIASTTTPNAARSYVTLISVMRLN